MSASISSVGQYWNWITSLSCRFWRNEILCLCVWSCGWISYCRSSSGNWLSSYINIGSCSLVSKSSNKCQIVKTVYFCTVLTIWHLPKHQLPNVDMTDEVSHFSVREMHLRCKQNVWISMMTVLEVSAQGFWRDLSVCIIRYWDSETTEQSASGAMREENWDNFLLSTIFTFHLTCEFLLLFELDTFASTYSRDFLPHTRGANGFRDRGHVVQSFSARWRQAILTHTPPLTENSVQVFKKRRDRGLTAVVQC